MSEKRRGSRDFRGQGAPWSTQSWSGHRCGHPCGTGGGMSGLRSLMQGWWRLQPLMEPAPLTSATAWEDFLLLGPSWSLSFSAGSLSCCYHVPCTTWSAPDSLAVGRKWISPSLRLGSPCFGICLGSSTPHGHLALPYSTLNLLPQHFILLLEGLCLVEALQMEETLYAQAYSYLLTFSSIVFLSTY